MKKLKTTTVKAIYRKLAMTVAVWSMAILPAFAADDPLATINSLSDFVFSCIRALGVILLGWGVVQIGMSLQSHDASQRTQGFLSFFGGLLIAFSKSILDTILS